MDLQVTSIDTLKQSYEVYVKTWRTANRVASRVEHQLSPGTHLTPLRPTALEHRSPPAPPLHSSSYPPIGNKLRTRTLLNPASIKQFGLHLQSRQDGSEESNWSQVWVAKASFLSGPTVSSIQVAIKLFQEGLCPLLEWDEWACGGWSASSLLKTEAWAYAMLNDLQGSLLPHSYGFFDFELPGGQIASGHVMEWIDGTALERDWECLRHSNWHSAGAREARSRKLATFLDCVNALHRRGVSHGDLRPENIMVPTEEPLCFVFIDFANAKPLGGDGDQRRVGAHQSERVQNDLSGVLKCLYAIEECPIAAQWIIERYRNEPWGGVFMGLYAVDTMKKSAERTEQLLRSRAGLHPK